MEEALRILRRRRVRMILVNLAYFLVLLGLGVLLFLKGTGSWAAYLLVAACVAGYLLLVRPLRQRYLGQVRQEILSRTVCGALTEVRYAAREGVAADRVRGVFSMAGADAFMSREHLAGRMGSMEAELADVTFPIVEEGRNAMFSGVFLQLTWPGSEFPQVSVDAGKWKGLPLPRQQLELVEQMDAFIPGSLYLRAGGDTLSLLLRGRFLAFPINPLMQISEKTLQSNPFPELDQAIRLAQLMRMGRRP